MKIDITQLIYDDIDIEAASDTYHELGDFEYVLEKDGMHIVYSIDRIYGGEFQKNRSFIQNNGNPSMSGHMTTWDRLPVEDIDITVIWCRYLLTKQDVDYIFDIETLKRQI